MSCQAGQAYAGRGCARTTNKAAKPTRANRRFMNMILIAVAILVQPYGEG
jgi:hypothetical protein